MKKQNLDFEVARNFFIEMKYCTIQNYLKICGHVAFCEFRCRSCSQKALFMVMRLLSTCTGLCYCVFRKKFLLLACFVVSKYTDSNGLCKFIVISIYKITEDHSVVASQTKNYHI